MDVASNVGLLRCVARRCRGGMERRHIVHTFVRGAKPIVVEDLPALVCPVCGYTVIEMQVLDSLYALVPDTQAPVGQAPVFHLTLPEAA